jgi:type VII secretion protein EccE
MSATDVQVRFGRRSTRGLILGFSAPRVAAIAVAAGFAVAGLVAANAVGLVVSALVWAPVAATAFVRVGGRPVVEWASTAAGYSARKSTGQDQYRATHPLKPRPAGTLALPGDAASLRLHHDEASGAVMIHDPHRQTLTGVVTVSHPAFVLLDTDDRTQRVSRWARVYASLAQTGTCAGVQVLEAAVPDPATGQVEWYDAHGHHDGSWADQQYHTLLDQVRLAAGTHRTTISLALDMRAASRAIKAAGRGVSGGAEVLRADMASLTDSLRQAGLVVHGWLAEPELAAIVRAAYDPATVLHPRTDPAANLAHAGPLAMSEHWDHLRHDSGWSSVLWISEWPRIDVAADFLHSIVFAPGVRRTLSLIARPLPTDVALRQIRKEKTDAVADMAHKQKVGQIADLSDAQEYEDLLSRERSVVAGHADVEFAGLVTVTATDQDTLEAARAQVVRAAAQAACEVRPLYGRQAQGFVCAALPLGRGCF